jgi:hypothetical protein
MAWARIQQVSPVTNVVVAVELISTKNSEPDTETADDSS